MKNLSQVWLDWALCETMLFFVYWVFYRALVKFRASPADKYLVLKLGFVSSAFVPFLSTLFSRAETESAVTHGARTMPLVAHSMRTLAPRATSGITGEIVGLLFVAYLLVVLYRLFRVWSSFVRLSTVVEEAEPLRLATSRWPVYVHSLKISPATVGFFRPRILIPRTIFETVSAERLQMILRHEEVHIERRDYLFNGVRAVVEALLPFSPFTRALGRHFEADMEISCDELLRARKQITPRPYAELLLELVANVSPRPELAQGGIFVSNSLITRRITAMKTISKKSRPLAMLGLFASLCAMFGVAVSALGLEPASGGASASLAATTKTLHFKVWAKVESESGKKSSQKETKSRLALNYDETGSLVLDNVVVRLTPRRKDGNSEMALQIWDERRKQAIYESVAPMTDSGEVEFSANLAPADDTYFRFNIGLTYLPADETAAELLQGKITLDVKNMKAEALLRKLAQAKKFNLVLGEGFPTSKLTTISVKDVGLSQLFDLVASGTDSQWSVDTRGGSPVVRFLRVR